MTPTHAFWISASISYFDTSIYHKIRVFHFHFSSYLDSGFWHFKWITVNCSCQLAFELSHEVSYSRLEYCKTRGKFIGCIPCVVECWFREDKDSEMKSVTKIIGDTQESRISKQHTTPRPLANVKLVKPVKLMSLLVT